ncbi:YsnF/AvaK domain-containing protein [Gloeobacter violaceus]|uniref:YsnF/AvaK domain-containing protein n=1 Tax=Gloeobacter violaceus TaxID=33072 RepID=UPI0013E8EA53|nr:YsnF/AvaK domain-containing protein [Gloeobacter violaceus]
MTSLEDHEAAKSYGDVQLPSSQAVGQRLIAGLFAKREAAEQAVRDLQEAGFGEEQIGVAFPGESAASDSKQFQDLPTVTATGGAVGGGVLGGLLGLLAGIGVLSVPGVGPMVAGGLLASVFAGLGLGAAGGSLLGALVGTGFSEAEAQHLESGVRSGASLVTIRSGGRVLEALAILERNGADTGPRAVSQPPLPFSAAEAPFIETDSPKQERLELLTERAFIRKERVYLGEITVRKETITELRTIEVPVTREELVVERRPTTESGAVAPVEEVVRIVLSEEQVSYQTRKVLKEAVSIEWHTTIEKKQIEVTLQREELRFDVEGKARVGTVDIPEAGEVDSASV